jgi:hypothetical protein
MTTSSGHSPGADGSTVSDGRADDGAIASADADGNVSACSIGSTGDSGACASVWSLTKPTGCTFEIPSVPVGESNVALFVVGPGAVYQLPVVCSPGDCARHPNGYYFANNSQSSKVVLCSQSCSLVPLNVAFEACTLSR